MEGMTTLSTEEYRKLVEERLLYQREAEDLREENEDLAEEIANLLVEQERARRDLEEAQKAIKDSGVIYWYNRCMELERAKQPEETPETTKEDETQ